MATRNRTSKEIVALSEKTKWSELTDEQAKLLFVRLHSRLESRSEAMSSWATLFAKVIVACNGTAAAASLAFMGAVYAKAADFSKAEQFKGAAGAKNLAANFSWSTTLFVCGLGVSLLFLLMAYVRARRALFHESQYLRDVLLDREKINWETNPIIRDDGQLLVAAGIVFSFLSFFLFAGGAVIAVWQLLSL